MLAPLLLLAAHASAASTATVVAPDTAMAKLVEELGRPAIQTLRDRAYVVIQGQKETERLQAVHWKALEQLSGLSGSASRFVDSARALVAGQPAKSAPEDLDRLAALPMSGAMTPELQSAAQGLAAIQRQLAALGAEGSAPSAVLGAQKPLFETPWGKKLSEETRADLSADPSGLVDRLWAELLAGPNAEPAASAHFQEWARRRAPNADARLEGDARSGRLSPELRRSLEKYLGEQRRLSELRRLNDSTVKLLKSRRATEQLASLEAAVRALASHQDLLRDLEAKAVPLDAASPRPKLTTSGAHLQAPTRLNQHELGDDVSVSGGYWVDGLKEGESVEVEETTFVERPTGFSRVRVEKVKRANGGPYAWYARVTVDESRDFALRAVISAPGSNPLSERVIVPVSRDFEVALSKLAAADAAVAACRFDAAEYGPLAAELAAPAKEKKQYDALKRAAESRAKDAAELQKTLAKLEGLIAESHADASPETCGYQTKRTADALAIARKLPAGCDRYVPALERRLADIRRRKAAQDAYTRAASESRSRRKSCAFAAAAERAASALAILDAEPAARCGALVDDHKTLERELVELRTAESWRGRVEEDLANTEKATEPDARLARARAVSARIGSLPDAECLTKERSRADAVASAAADAIQGSASPIPPDQSVARVEAEITAERRRVLDAQQTVTGKSTEAQTPVQPGETPASMGKDDRSRLDCLESGFKVNRATIDCKGNPFDIAELKTLRGETKPSKPAGKKAPVKKRSTNAH